MNKEEVKVIFQSITGLSVTAFKNAERRRVYNSSRITLN